MSQFEILVDTSSAIVFDSFITDTRLSEWFCQDAQIEARPEGRFYAYWSNPKFYVMGEILEFERPNLLKLQWNDLEGTNIALEITFIPEVDNTRVCVRSEQALGEKATAIWTKGLEALKSTLEQGYRPEVFEDAFLGLLGVTTLTLDNANLYTPHCQTGLFIQGILKNSSLDMSGFKHGDVLTQVGQQPLKTIGDLIAVLNPLQINDLLELEFWRGAEQKKQLLTMQKRHLPAYPVSLEDLATYRQQVQHQAQADLEAFAKTVLEPEAHFKFRPDTWSAAEIVAHLINAERDTLTQIAYLQVGNSVRSFTTSLQARIEALMKRYQTLPALVQALSQAQAETCDLIRHLSPNYLERKSHVTRIQFASDITAAHIQQHLGQIKRAVAKARVS